MSVHNRPEVATILPAAVKMQKDWALTGPMVLFVIFKKNNHKFHRCVRIKSNTLQPPVSVLDARDGPYLACTSFISLKERDCIRPIQNVSLRSASDSPLQVIANIMLFSQRGDLEAWVHFGVVDNLFMALLFGTWFIDKSIRGIFR